MASLFVFGFKLFQAIHQCGYALNGHGVVDRCPKTAHGFVALQIVKASGLGAYEDFLTSLAEVDSFFKNLDAHKSTKY